MHRDSVSTKVGPNMESILKIVVQRDSAPFRSEEADVKDASEINLVQLIDIKGIDIIDGNNTSTRMDDALMISFNNQSFF